MRYISGKVVKRSPANAHFRLRNELDIPLIGFSTENLNEEDLTRSLWETVIGEKYILFDLSEKSSDSEESLGNYLKDSPIRSRKYLFLQSKNDNFSI